MQLLYSIDPSSSSSVLSILVRQTSGPWAEKGLSSQLLPEIWMMIVTGPGNIIMQSRSFTTEAQALLYKLAVHLLLSLRNGPKNGNRTTLLALRSCFVINELISPSQLCTPTALQDLSDL